MASRVGDPGGHDERPGWLPLIGLGAIVVITTVWWALALWPVSTDPGWLARTREVCFGAGPDGLPSAGGWAVLIGQPVGMLGVLVTVWGGQLAGGLNRLAANPLGRTTLAVVSLALVAGLVGATTRVWGRGSDATDGLSGSLSGVVTVDRSAPPISLIDQHGATVSLRGFQGRPVLVTFAFAHCTAICPAQVRGVLAARRRVSEKGLGAVVLVVTVDPRRDTPSRLAAIADGWEMRGDEYVLSGSVEAVEAVHRAWRVPVERDSVSGDVGHAATVYLVGRDGRIAALGLGTGRDLARAVEDLAQR